MTRHRLLLAIVLSCWLPTALSFPASVSTPACDQSSSVINDLKGIPRLNFKASLISSDPGAYDWYSCTTDAYGNEDCSWFNPFSSLSALYQSAPSSSSPTNFLQAYGVLFAFALLCALLTVVTGLSLCVGRYCLSCCIKGGTCGKRWPTVKTRCCGIQADLATGAMAYSAKERWCARGFMWTFVAFIVTFILVSYFNGAASIPSSMKAVAAAPAPLVSTLQSLSTPVRDLIISLSTETVPQLISSVNSTINDAVDLTSLLSDMNCILDATGQLPNTTALLDVLQQLSAGMGAANALLASVPSVMGAVNSQLDNVTDGIAAVQSDLANVSSQVNATVLTLQAISGSLAVLAQFTTNATSTSSGIPSITSDLTGISTSLPNTTEVSDAQVQLQQLAQPNTDSFGQTTATQHNLQSMQLLYLTSPDYADTGSRLQQLQDEIDHLNSISIFNALQSDVDNAQLDIAAMAAAINSTNTTINSLVLGSGSLELTPATHLLEQLQLLFAQVTGAFAVVGSQLALIGPLQTVVVPCFYQALDGAVSFNATLLQLPVAFDAVLTLAPTLNSSVAAAASSAANISLQIDGFETALAGFSLSLYLQQIQNISSQSAAATDNVVSGSSMQMLNSAYAATQSANFSGDAQLQQLNSTINSIPFNSSLDAALESLQQLKLNALALMAVIIPDLEQINTVGYCATSGAACNSSLPCASDSGSCQHDPANGGSADTGRCQQYGNVTCASDATCATQHAGDHCLVDSARLAWLSGNITAIQAVTPPSAEFAPLLSGLSAAETAAQPNNSGLSSMNATVTSTIASLQSTSPAALNSALASVNSSVSGSLDTSSLLSQVGSVQASMQTVDLSAAQSTVESLSSTLQEVEADVPDLQEAQQLVSTLHSLLFYQMHVYLAEVSEPNLQAAYDSGGLRAMATLLLSIVDNCTLYINNSQYIAPTSLSTSVITGNVAHYLDVLSTAAYSQYGPVYFLAMLAAQSQTLDLSVFPASETARFDVDASGADYPNGTYCVSTDCIDSSIDYYTTSSLSTVSSGSIPISLSGVQALSVPLLIPAVIALLGLLSSLMYKSAGWASCCSSCTACLVFVVTPFVFVLVGLLWPIVVLGLSDSCRGGASIGNQYVQLQQASLCSDLSGNSSGSLCTVTQYNVTVSFDVGAVYDAVLGSSCSASNDPLASAWQQIAGSVSSFPVSKIDSAIDSVNSGSGQLRLRPAVISLAQAAANSSGAYFADAVEQAGQLLGCASLSSMVDSMKAAVCCTTASTFYWAIGGWYLIAFSFLLCGWEAALLGRKRFAKDIWGPDVVPLINPDALAQRPIVEPATYFPTVEYAYGQQQEEQQQEAELPPPLYSEAPPPSAPSADGGDYEVNVPRAQEDESIVKSSLHQRHQSQQQQHSRHTQQELSRTPSRSSRRPSAIRAGDAANSTVVVHQPLPQSVYPVLISGDDGESGDEEDAVEQPSPMPAVDDSRQGGDRGVDYAAMYPPAAGHRGSSASEVSASSRGSLHVYHPTPSPDMRAAHLLAGYPDQSPSPLPDDSPRDDSQV